MWRLALLALVAGCWRGEPPAPAPPPLRPEPEVAAGRTRAGWVPGQPGKRPTSDLVPRAIQDVARDLAAQVRFQPAVLTAMIAGPIVLLDLDVGTVTTECGPTVPMLVQQWAQLLADPTRPVPMCIGSGTSVVCSQRTSTPLLIVELDDPNQLHIVSVIVGSFRAGRAAMNQKIPLMRSMIATAACP